MRGMLFITYRGRPAAYVTAGAISLLPRLAALEPDHPERPWIVCLAFFVQDVLTGRLRGPCTEGRAAHFARCALMPEQEFAALADEPDVALAELFNVPLAQVRERRLDLVVVGAVPHTT